MKIDTKEMHEVAAAAAPRLDMYGPIHKALRAFMADTLLALGRMDTADELEFVQVTQRVLELMDFCRSHLAHENRFVHTAMDERKPGSAGRIAREHEDHERHIALIAAGVAALRAQAVAARPAAAMQLYRDLAAFVAENFVHMNVEETEHNAVLWSHYTDAELQRIHDELVASVPPPEMLVVLRWMVPFMNPAERAGMLAGMREHAPAPAFQAALDTVRPHLTAREWDKLEAALGL
ncbi:hemerythrin domain-containing protein [Ramlibacter sp. PS4R-6]|uniref:hemerythrin domain-containing protein n=1 Tax=Ramlibacter sp. PS4R-6 TaxID=3133438 RepID=UPI00309D7598